MVNFAGTLFSVTRAMANRIIIADWNPDRIIFATTVGEIIAEYAWPQPAPNTKASPPPATDSKTSLSNTTVVLPMS
ncbi:MAG TPA: hypothetical protein K8V32_01495 [Enteractinococcus helveticum]|uniref:Uncharacterized protein n=1 Tax=Enteractinococcus helveticum TaxID=1837282 RepID=A0A921K6G2_9MICC|nr:hypothetical protein [Enteractinococcus helveticum]HJF13463.1 hypothetical protein [Enteractinococcus helveticum]